MTIQTGFTPTIIAKTAEYLRVPAVVGHEAPFLNYLYHDYSDLGFNTKRGDNIVAVSGSDPQSAYLSAHIDRHGIVSIGGGDHRYAAYAVKNYKYNEAGKINSLRQMAKIGSRFKGEQVYAYGRWSGSTITRGTVGGCRLSEDSGNLIFAIKDMAEMPEGIPIAYAAGAVEKDGYVQGQLDNTISIGLIYGLFKAGFQGTAIFTAEEEIGKSWKHLSSFLDAHTIATDNLIVLDTTPYKDTAAADNGLVVLRNRDSLSPFNADTVRELRSLCQLHNIPHEFKDEILIKHGKSVKQLGRTELGRLIVETASRWTGASVQIPTSNYHTNNETTTPLAINNCFNLLCRYLGILNQ